MAVVLHGIPAALGEENRSGAAVMLLPALGLPP